MSFISGISHFSSEGTVRAIDGGPSVADLKVTIFVRTLFDEFEAGEVRTDINGNYHLAYSLQHWPMTLGHCLYLRVFEESLFSDAELGSTNQMIWHLWSHTKLNVIGIQYPELFPSIVDGPAVALFASSTGQEQQTT